VASGTIVAQWQRETRCLKPVGVNYIWVEIETKVKVFGAGTLLAAMF
jgi:hypothetical protein